MLWELKKAYCGFLDTSSMKGGQVAAVGGGGGGGQKSSVSQRHKKNQGHLSQAIFEASIAVAVANSVSDLNSRMCTHLLQLNHGEVWNQRVLQARVLMSWK
jgi:hypothetical protein